MITQDHKPFNVDEVPLNGSNLIEASAGTGKTYSIAILTLRSILSGVTIREIIMVTFTKKAVAELETRIREFIRSAREFSMGGETDQPLIRELVNNAKQEFGEKIISERINSAVLLLDETSIQTIHSFCQRTLTEYAFETGQVFGSNTMTDQDSINLMNEALNHFWRKSITTLHPEILKAILDKNFTRKSIRSAVKIAMSGKILFSFEPYKPGFLDTSAQLELLETWQNIHQAVSIKKINMIAQIESNREILIEAIKQNNYARNSLADQLENFSGEDILTFIIEKNKKAPPKYISLIFQEYFGELEELKKLEFQVNNLTSFFINQLYQYAIEEISQYIHKRKQEKSWITFDDMIIKLHESVVIKNHQGLQNGLRKTYKAVFIDEFQDTDKLQYEIFQTLFGSHSTLFYIGDPKQSIYAFRKADIYTYFKASQIVNHRYSMNINYRSSNSMIKALNHFFMPENGFDTFRFEGRPESIAYMLVDPPENQDKGELWFKDNPIHPLIIQEGENKDDIALNVVKTVVHLLNDTNYTLPSKEGFRRQIQPSDFGILVRDKFEAKNIKKRLAEYNIPSVTIDDTKILNTTEAKELLFVLEAVCNISTAAVNKALLTSLTGMYLNDLLKLDEVMIMEQFHKYQHSWQQQGIFVMLMQFITDFNVRSRYLSAEVVQGERKLSNIMQLIELFHKIEKVQQYAPLELVNWLRKGIEDENVSGDEYEQRIENDEDAIQIITIHKSKGLEYNIVLAPYLDLLVKQDQDLLSFRNPSGEEYYFLNKDLLSPEQISAFQIDAEQENRRLVYVALTRSKYACYINSNRNNKNNFSALRPFITILKNDLPQSEENGIVFNQPPDIPTNFRYKAEADPCPAVFAHADQFSLLQPNWKKMSYSFLNPEHQSTRSEIISFHEDPFDRFVFHDLKKGAHTGNLIHYILERINFSDSSNWKNIIKQALKRLSTKQDDDYIEKLFNLFQQLMHVEIDAGLGGPLTLSLLSPEQCLNELEFDFGVAPFQPSELEKIGKQEFPLSVKTYNELEGIMNGKMDLFFEWKGKYYILDWKTNHLGYEPEDYDTEGILQAMEDNNYHLQYTIYTLALLKYLRLRKSDFDYNQDFGGVIYIFLRGVRIGKKTGLFIHRPNQQLIHDLEKLFQQKVSVI